MLPPHENIPESTTKDWPRKALQAYSPELIVGNQILSSDKLCSLKPEIPFNSYQFLHVILLLQIVCTLHFIQNYLNDLLNSDKGMYVKNCSKTKISDSAESWPIE